MGNATTNNDSIIRTKSSSSKLNMTIKDKRIFGLNNNSNNCYVNSVIQCLLSNQEFYNGIINLSKSELSSKYLLYKALLDLITQADTLRGKIGMIDIRKFLLAIRKSNELFNNEDHHDAHEFLIFLIDSLHENIIKESKSKVKSLNS